MAHSLSAKKRIRQAEKHRGRNRWRKDQAKGAVKSLEQALHSGKKQDAAAKFKDMQKTLDKVAAKGTIHKNAVARKKSRMAKRVNKMAASASA